MLPIRQSSRLLPFLTDAGGGGALYVLPNYPIQIVSVGYSWTDLNSKFGTTANNLLQSRIAIIRGPFGDDPDNFGAFYNLESYQKLVDFYINDLGPGYAQFPAEADETRIEPGEGVTILIAKPVVTGIAGTNMQGSVMVSSAGLQRALRANGPNGGGGASAAAGGGTSGGSSGGGSYGGSFTGGGSTGGSLHQVNKL
jgi:hypothetical protein